MSKQIWQDQPAEMVLDTLGRPVDIEQKVLKTKKKEIWKSGFLGNRQYDLIITLDNGKVTGWDKKSI